MEELDTHNDFREKTLKSKSTPTTPTTPTTQVVENVSPVGWRMKIWRVTDYHENTVIAKVYYFVVY